MATALPTTPSYSVEDMLRLQYEEEFESGPPMYPVDEDDSESLFAVDEAAAGVPPGGTTLIKCGMCYRRCKSEEELESHIALLHAAGPGLRCPYPECDKIFQSDHIRTHFRAKHSLDFKKFVCTVPECGIVCSTTEYVKHHAKIEHFNGAFKCHEEDCPMGYRSAIPLHLHKRDKHTQHVEYSCHVCGFLSSNLGTFSTHIEDQHPELTSDDAYCESCKLKYSCDMLLDIHNSLVHSVETSTYATEHNALAPNRVTYIMAPDDEDPLPLVEKPSALKCLSQDCHVVATTPLLLHNHMKRHHEVTWSGSY